jgi:hypothetical protein
MQPRTPPRKFSRCINGYGVFAIPVADSDHSKQFDGQLSLPAADACPNRSTRRVDGAFLHPSRSLALDHS